MSQVTTKLHELYTSQIHFTIILNSYVQSGTLSNEYVDTQFMFFANHFQLLMSNTSIIHSKFARSDGTAHAKVNSIDLGVAITKSRSHVLIFPEESILTNFFQISQYSGW